MRKLIRALPPVTFAAVALIAWFTPASQSQADHDSFNSSPTSTDPLYPPALYPTSSILDLTPLPGESVPPALYPTSSILDLTPLPGASVPPALYPTSSILDLTPLPGASVPPALYPTSSILDLTPLPGASVPPALYPTSSILDLTPLPGASVPPALYPTEGQFDDFVSVLSADTVSEEQVSSAVDAILENDLSETEAESLAQSEKVLESIDGDQAVEIFAAIELDGLTDEEGAKIADAVQKADNDVRGAFEDELNIFEGQFDTYVPLNSKINVEDRRTVVAVSVVSTASVATMGVRSAMPVGGGAPAGGGSAELAEAFKSESNRIRRIRIYKYINGRRVVDKKNFSRKLVLSIMQNSFTLVGFIVVYLTLSGSVRTIAGIATLVAFFSTLYIDMREGDED
jgi:hypothetical protein